MIDSHSSRRGLGIVMQVCASTDNRSATALAAPGNVRKRARVDLDLDSTPPTARIRTQLQRTKRGLELVDVKTMRSRRRLHLPAPLVEDLRRHRARQSAERLALGSEWRDQLGLVFTTPFGTPVDPRNFSRLVGELCVKAGIGHWSPHELRHSCASLLLAQGVPLEVVSEVLGHSSIRVTKDVYGHLMAPARAQAAEAMQQALW